MCEQPKAESGDPDITERLQHMERYIGDEYRAEVCYRARKEIERLREALRLIDDDPPIGLDWHYHREIAKHALAARE